MPHKCLSFVYGAGPRPPVARSPADPRYPPPHHSFHPPPAGLAPEQVAGRLARDAGRPVLSHETIYRFLYAQIARTKLMRGVTLSLTPKPPAAARPSLATPAPSSPPSTPSMPSASRPSSATPTPPGRKAASRTPSAVCAAPCPAKPTWPPCPTSGFITWFTRTTTPRGRASGMPRPRRLFSTKCWT